jgi:hypothetical protein
MALVVHGIADDDAFTVGGLEPGEAGRGGFASEGSAVDVLAS